jgi:hypothetical protein
MSQKLSDIILQTAKEFAAKEVENNGGKAMEGSIVAAFISGCSLTAHYLIGNDGHPNVTPQNLEVSAQNAAEKFGLSKGNLQDEVDGK